MIDKIDRGTRILNRATLNRTIDRVNHDDPYNLGGESVQIGNPILVTTAEPPFGCWARIIGPCTDVNGDPIIDANDHATWQWTESVRFLDSGTPNWRDKAFNVDDLAPRQSYSPSTGVWINAAREANNREVAVNSIVWMRPGIQTYSSDLLDCEHLFVAGGIALGDFTLNGSGGTNPTFTVTFSAGGATHPHIIIDGGDSTKLLMFNPGSYEFRGYLDIYDNGGIDSVARSVIANLYVNGADPTPFATRYRGDGVDSQVAISTLVVIDAGDLTGGPNSNAAEITIVVTLNPNLAYVPVDFIVNDGELIVQ